MRMRRLTVLGALDRLHHEYLGAKRRKSVPPQRVLKTLQGRWLGWLVLLAGIAGCAAISVDSTPEEKTQYLAQRAEARWQLLIKGDVAGAYEFLSKGSKAGTSVEAYKAKIHPGMWREAKVEKVECEKEICKVQLQITYDARRMKGIQTPVIETWIIENGTAGFVYR